MASALFSKLVLDGLVAVGIDIALIAEWAKVPVPKVRAVADSGGRFSYRQLIAIEHASGRTAGEWAISNQPDVDPAFAALIAAWADPAAVAGSDDPAPVKAPASRSGRIAR